MESDSRKNARKNDEALHDPKADVFKLKERHTKLKPILKALETSHESTKEENDFQIAVKSASEIIDTLPVISTLQDADEIEHTILLVAQQVLGEKCSPDALQKLVDRVKETPAIKETFERFENRKVQAQKDILRHTLEAYLETRKTVKDITLYDVFDRGDFEDCVINTCEKHKIELAVCKTFLTENLPERLLELAKELILESVVNEQMRGHIEKLLAAQNIDDFSSFYKQNDDLIDMAIPQEKKHLLLFVMENHLFDLIKKLRENTFPLGGDEFKQKARALLFYLNKYKKISATMHTEIDFPLETTIRELIRRAQQSRLDDRFIRNQMSHEIEWVLKRIEGRKGELSPEEQEVLENILNCKSYLNYYGIKSFYYYRGDHKNIKPKKMIVDTHSLIRIMKHDLIDKALNNSWSYFSDSTFVIDLLTSPSSPIKMTDKIPKNERQALFERAQLAVEQFADARFYFIFSKMALEQQKSAQ